MSSQIKQPIHIVTATPQDIAEVVILCGDPKRAEVIAKTFLRSVRVVSRIRCANYYTGLYQNTKITVGTSGMGSASCAIYAFELYYFYNVQTIIRFGSCGSYQHQVRLGDLIIGVETTGENNFQQRLLGTNQTVLTASTCVSKALQAGAKALLPSQDLVHSGLIHSAELFYRERLDD